jgi:hypothetical protein
LETNARSDEDGGIGDESNNPRKRSEVTGRVTRQAKKSPDFRFYALYDKVLCMIVPIARFESVLYNAETYEGLRLPGGSNLATLLGSYLSTLTDSVMMRNDNTPFDTIDVTLELLGAAFRAQRRSSTITPRDQLFARISDDIEARLNDQPWHHEREDSFPLSLLLN